MSDVCIIGVGIHPFGRTDGVEGIDQGVFAVREALKDAGVEWPDIQFAYGSSDAAGNPDTMVERLGLTGPLQGLSDKALAQAEERLRGGGFHPNGTEGFAKAEVTAGGISTAELSSQTMEAKKVPGLFAIGEAVDVTGWLGGYNFQWAWASGQACGEAL